MRVYGLLLVALLVVAVAVEAKKPPKKVKREAHPEKLEKQHKEPKAPKPEKVEKVVEKVVVVKEVPAHAHVEEAHEHAEAAVHAAVAAEAAHKELHRPKALKTLTAYDLCKAECKTKRDQENAEQYVQRLREELAAAENLLTKEKEAHAAAEQQGVVEQSHEEPQAH